MDVSDTEDWPALLARYVEDQTSVGAARSTVQTRARRLLRLADHLGVDPISAPPERIARYLDALAAREPATAKAQRLAVRSFYRWAVATGRRASEPAPGVRRTSAPAAWLAALDEWAVHQRRTGLAPATIDKRAAYLRRLATATGVPSPWAVTSPTIHGWLESLQVSRSSRITHRDAVRAFYRWATSAGRVFADPMQPSYSGPSALAVPDAWATELVEYRSSLRAGGRAESSIATYLGLLRNFARQNSHVAPYEVTTDQLASWMGNKRWARETRRKNRAALLAFYAWAVTGGRMSANPVSNLPTIRAAQPVPRPAADDEYTEALRRADPRENLALRLAAELGMRRGEVARVHSRDVQGAHGARELIVLGKGGKVRRIPLVDGLAAVILACPPGYLFPGNYRGHLSPRWMGVLLSRLLPPGVTMHQLRHRFASRAYAIDRDLFGVQQLLGHASPATTRGYVQLSVESLRRLVEGVAS